MDLMLLSLSIKVFHLEFSLSLHAAILVARAKVNTPRSCAGAIGTCWYFDNQSLHLENFRNQKIAGSSTRMSGWTMFSTLMMPFADVMFITYNFKISLMQM